MTEFQIYEQLKQLADQQLRNYGAASWEYKRARKAVQLQAVKLLILDSKDVDK